MPRTDSIDADKRRALRQELRGVARLLRYAGLAMVLLGAAGLVTGVPDAWWLGPSWFSLAVGWALLLAGMIRRVRERRRGTDGLPES